MIAIRRIKEVPESLAQAQRINKGNYNDFDVVQQLIEDSGNKCYLCELKELTDPEVEHLLPHEKGKYLTRKYDWNNLFLVCRHCNNVKNQIYNHIADYMDGILTRDQFWALARFKYPTHQISFCSLESLKCLEFVSGEEVVK